VGSLTVKALPANIGLVVELASYRFWSLKRLGDDFKVNGALIFCLWFLLTTYTRDLGILLPYVW